MGGVAGGEVTGFIFDFIVSIHEVLSEPPEDNMEGGFQEQWILKAQIW